MDSFPRLTRWQRAKQDAGKPSVLFELAAGVAMGGVASLAGAESLFAIALGLGAVVLTYLGEFAWAFASAAIRQDREELAHLRSEVGRLAGGKSAVYERMGAWLEKGRDLEYREVNSASSVKIKTWKSNYHVFRAKVLLDLSPPVLPMHEYDRLSGARGVRRPRGEGADRFREAELADLAALLRELQGLMEGYARR